MKKFSYPESLVSEHRQHVIAHADAIKLVEHLTQAEYEKSDGTNWNVSDFNGKTIEQAGKDIETAISHQRMLIHGFICVIFDYIRVG